jgi:lysophospholipid acyltransferase (LPLAT)-like uncharacterized protein
VSGQRRDGERPPGWWTRVRVRAIAVFGGFVIRALGMTWRVRRDGAHDFDAMLRRGEPFVVVFWHGEILPLAWVHRHNGIATVISRHADGEVIARIAERLGYRTVRGSTTRGGARALLQSAALVEDGTTVSFTPDGPRGPRHEFAPGAVIVAQRTGRPIIAVTATASRAWRLRSWDRHLVPKPFATLTVRYSAAEYVRAKDAREAAGEQPRFAALLGSLTGPD